MSILEQERSGMKSLERLNPNFKSQINGEEIAAMLISKLAKQTPILEAYLFGSAASGQMTSDSDIDLLIVIADDLNVSTVYSQVHKPFFSPIAVDWLVFNKSDFDLKKDFGGIAFIAFHQGKKMEILK